MVGRQLFAEPLEHPQLAFVDLVAIAREQARHDLDLAHQQRVVGRRRLPERRHAVCGLFEAPAPRRQVDRGQPDAREAPDRRFVQGRKRTFDQAHIALHGELPAADGLEDRCQQGAVPASLRMLQRRQDVTVLVQPRCRPRVQVVEVPTFASQPLGQELGEQPVISEPFPVLVDRMHEQVPPFELLEHLPALRLAIEAGAEVPVDALEDRRAQQELLLVAVELTEYLFEEVPGEIGAAAGQFADRRFEVVALVETASHHLQRGRPPLGATDQAFDQRRSFASRNAVAEVRGGILDGEAQVAVGDLEESLVQAQVRGDEIARQRPRPEDDPEIPRQVFHEMVQAIHDRGTGGPVEVVEHEHVFPLAGGEGREQQPAQGVRVLRLDPLPPSEEARFGTRFEEVAGELVDGAVELVEGQPRHGDAARAQAVEPLSQKRGLPVSGGCMHDGQSGRLQTANAVRFEAALDTFAWRHPRRELGSDQKGRLVAFATHPP